MSSLERTANSLWQMLMHVIWRGHCARCRGMWGTAGHHITKRRYHAVKYAIMNGILLCASCHEWAENHEQEFLQWLREKYYSLYVWHMQNLNPPIRRIPAWEMREIIKQLRVAIKELSK